MTSLHSQRGHTKTMRFSCWQRQRSWMSKLSILPEACSNFLFLKCSFGIIVFWGGEFLLFLVCIFWGVCLLKVFFSEVLNQKITADV